MITEKMRDHEGRQLSSYPDRPDRPDRTGGTVIA